MPMFKRKPDEPIDAEQFIDTDKPPRGVQRSMIDSRMFVVTAQGRTVYVLPGEWIAKEPYGSGYYPIADHVMKKIYEQIL